MDIANTEIAILLEAVLFYSGEPMKKSALLTILDISSEHLETALAELTQTLTERGVVLVQDGDFVALGTAPAAQTVIERMRREELEGPLGKAGLETLAVVIYQGPVSRADIEYIRGVNCSSILRSLTMRGLIAKKENPHDKRSYVYSTTPELPAALGLTSLNELPDYDALREHIATLIHARDSEQNTPDDAHET